MSELSKLGAEIQRFKTGEWKPWLKKLAVWCGKTYLMLACGVILWAWITSTDPKDLPYLCWGIIAALIAVSTEEDS